MNKIFNQINRITLLYLVIECIFLLSFYLDWKHARLKGNIYPIDLVINFTNLLASFLMIIYHYHRADEHSLIIKFIVFIIVIIFNINLYLNYLKKKNKPIYLDKIF